MNLRGTPSFADEFCRRIGYNPTDRQLLWFIIQELEIMSVDIQQIKTDLTTLSASNATLATANGALVTALNTSNTALASAQAQVAALQAQLANGTPVSQDDLNSIDQSIQSDIAEVNSLTAAAQAALSPPAAPSAGTAPASTDSARASSSPAS